MAYEWQPYNKLRTHIFESIYTLLRHHLDPKIQYNNISQLDYYINKLPHERRMQVNILLKTMNLLDASSLEDKEKSIILTALSYYIHQQIKNNVKYKIIFSPLRSNFFQSLTTSLNLKENNQPDEDEEKMMYEKLSVFLKSYVYNEGDPLKGYKMFSLFKEIKEYSVEDHIIELKERILVLEKSIIEREKYNIALSSI
ncbi:MAG TPA: hypothetical protein PK657_07485 [Legionella sp.]|nr:hypothetical protein [Legionella sp.]